MNTIHLFVTRKHTGLIQALSPHAHQELEMLCNFNTFFFNLNTRPQMLNVIVHIKVDCLNQAYCLITNSIIISGMVQNSAS